ncbi:DUF2252 domain-containing protein [Mumia sp. DW29H23]|uniref:DUF2252 domain-containing protein n=1 Tax=Mumia sp. DW29H23 TaxID=3421241 RepID=UPI003D68A853
MDAHEIPTVDDRAARGKAVRDSVPRSSHAGWVPDPHRRDPLTVLEEQAADRVAELVPIRYGRMARSAFAFYRGAAALMAQDLASVPHSGLNVQLCGDAHLSNFGTFAAPDRRLIFSINDFDETLPGPFEWDVKRLAASFAIAGRERGFTPKQREAVVRSAVASYRTSMRDLGKTRRLDVWYARADVDEMERQAEDRLTPDEAKRMRRNVAKARAKDSVKAYSKLVEVVDGSPRITSRPPLVVPLRDLLSDREQHRLETSIDAQLQAYGRSLPAAHRHLLSGFRFVEAARKVGGVGSVGTRAWIALLLGNDAYDPLFLQLKEAQPSVLEAHLPHSVHRNHGQRVVEGQRLMQPASDVLLGWIRTDGIDGTTRDFYVRQLWDGKGSALVDVMSAATMVAYAEVCGATLARAHARSGDAAEIGGYLGSNDRFDRALADFAEAYADQNERDHAALRDAIDAGRVAAEDA